MYASSLTWPHVYSMSDASPQVGRTRTLNNIIFLWKHYYINIDNNNWKLLSSKFLIQIIFHNAKLAAYDTMDKNRSFGVNTDRKGTRRLKSEKQNQTYMWISVKTLIRYQINFRHGHENCVWTIYYFHTLSWKCWVMYILKEGLYYKRIYHEIVWSWLKTLRWRDYSFT
jgi:hypothetical protein